MAESCYVTKAELIATQLMSGHPNKTQIIRPVNTIQPNYTTCMYRSIRIEAGKAGGGRGDSYKAAKKLYHNLVTNHSSTASQPKEEVWHPL